MPQDDHHKQRTPTIVARKAQAKQDLEYWLSRPIAERIAAVEVLRLEAFAADPSLDPVPRLQRVCRIIRRGQR